MGFCDVCAQQLDFQVIFETFIEMETAVDELLFATKDLFNYPPDKIPAGGKTEMNNYKLIVTCFYDI